MSIKSKWKTGQGQQAGKWKSFFCRSKSINDKINVDKDGKKASSILFPFNQLTLCGVSQPNFLFATGEKVRERNNDRKKDEKGRKKRERGERRKKG